MQKLLIQCLDPYCDENMIEATKSSRRRVPTEQWKANRRCSIALQTTLAEHSCLTLFSDSCVGHSFVGHFSGTLLWDTLAWHSCSTLLWHTLVKHSLNTLKHSCNTLLLEKSGTPRSTTKRPHSAAQYYFILQILHKALPSITSHSRLHTPHLILTHHIPHSTLLTPHSTLHTQPFTLHIPHSTLRTQHFTL